eukprot:35292-Pyramimonas_sp.AAC.1
MFSSSFASSIHRPRHVGLRDPTRSTSSCTRSRRGLRQRILLLPMPCVYQSSQHPAAQQAC